MLQELGVQPPVGYWDPAGLAKDGDVETFKRRRRCQVVVDGRSADEIFMGFHGICVGMSCDFCEFLRFLLDGCGNFVGIECVFFDWIEGEWDGMEFHSI